MRQQFVNGVFAAVIVLGSMHAFAASPTDKIIGSWSCKVKGSPLTAGFSFFKDGTYVREISSAEQGLDITTGGRFNMEGHTRLFMSALIQRVERKQTGGTYAVLPSPPWVVTRDNENIMRATRYLSENQVVIGNSTLSIAAIAISRLDGSGKTTEKGEVQCVKMEAFLLSALNARRDFPPGIAQ